MLIDYPEVKGKMLNGVDWQIMMATGKPLTGDENLVNKEKDEVRNDGTSSGVMTQSLVTVTTRICDKENASLERQLDRNRPSTNKCFQNGRRRDEKEEKRGRME